MSSNAVQKPLDNFGVIDDFISIAILLFAFIRTKSISTPFENINY